MNANELADELEQTLFESTRFEAATMLRQQQVRIEELQESERNLIGHLNESDVEIEALKSHPVKEHFEDEPQAEELHEILQSNAELTDEEIEKIKQALTIAMGCTLELSPCAEEFCKQEQLPWLEATESLAREALAILRKASEKC